MPILRVYRRDADALTFREAWFDEETAQFVVNHGPVGRLSETPVVEDDIDAERGAELLEAFAEQCAEDGYAELGVEEQQYLYVRFPIKGDAPSAREQSLRENVVGALTGHLAWRGLGTVEGVSFGPQRMSVVVLTPDAKDAVRATVSCLREAAKSDLPKVIMAVAPGASPEAARIKHPTPPKGGFPVDPLPAQA